LHQRCVEVVGAQAGKAHRQAAAVREELIVAQIGVLGGEAHCLGRGEAYLEAGDPVVARRAYRLFDEIGAAKGKTMLRATFRASSASANKISAPAASEP
jgi:hypothetical protein